MLLIPTDASGTLFEYIEDIALDESVFAFKFSWNEQLDHWVLSVFASDGTPIVQGRMIANGVDLLRGCVVAGRPLGLLVAVPLDGTNEHAGYTGLGSRVGLYYKAVGE
jgi:hypothetical protein